MLYFSDFNQSVMRNPHVERFWSHDVYISPIELKTADDALPSVLLNSHLLSEIELVCDRVAILLGGELVAAGTPAELSRPRGVELETDAGTHLVEGATRDDVPRLVATAVHDGRDVYGVRVLTSTLEDTYLEAVGGETD